MDKPTGYATIWPETNVTLMMGKTNLCQSDSYKLQNYICSATFLIAGHQ
jgi:hypothetical protein